jgi:hypothetical protein
MANSRFIILVTLLFLNLYSYNSIAADNPNLLVMGEDADNDSIPRHSRVFKRVVNALANQMHDSGFDVYDEVAVTNGTFEQGRARRTDAELFGIAGSIQRPPMDIAVVFTIYASLDNKGYTQKVKVRIEGRLLQIKTGQRLGNFEMKNPKSWNAPVNCSRECILEVVGDYSKILAQDIGAVLAEKLAWMVDIDDETGKSTMATGYTLLIDNYSPEEVMNMEEYLKIFSGYISHRPIYSTARRSEVWYQSSIDSAKLNSNLKKMLKALNLHGMVLFSGNTYTIKKTTAKKVLKPVEGDW